jgi:uncharacterized protein
MRVIISGGTGMLGRKLSHALMGAGHEVIVLSRSSRPAMSTLNNVKIVQWDGSSGAGWQDLIIENTAIVNFAGENLKGKSFIPQRWTRKRKEILVNSRLLAGRAILDAIQTAPVKPDLLIQSSAVGYYGTHTHEPVDEDSLPGEDFLARLCADWENSTANIDTNKTRRVILRTGVVLAQSEGIFPLVTLPFKLFAGGRLGSGKQPFPWIHLDDVIAAILFLMEHKETHGAYNLTAPQPTTYAELAHAISQTIHRPNWIHVPEIVLKAALGEVATLVIDGQQAIPKKLIDSGFQFTFPSIESALQDLL